MRFEEAVKYLLSLGHETLAIKLGLDNIVRLLDALNNPQRSFPSTQIAGTNGKGSTAAMLDAICGAAKIKTGLYTSPHLVSINERIRIAGHEIVPDEFARLTADVRTAAFQMQSANGALPSFFEQMTAIALAAFRSSQVQLAILETGLGGRLDATTAARAGTVAITPVAYDHQEYLGHTLQEIAAEKAAIIHTGADAILAPQPTEALEVILARCRECQVAPRFATSDVRVHDADETGRLRVSFQTLNGTYQSVRLALRGRHQTINAATAIALAESLRERGFTISREAIIEGLETARHEGRLELIAGAPALLFDGAHNPAGAQSLRIYLDEFAHAPITFIFGAMRDKELEKIEALLFPVAHKVILAQPTNSRAATTDALAALAPLDFDRSRIMHAPRPAEALRLARETTTPDGLICITGSLYLIGEIKALLASEAANLKPDN